jgi:DNA (cytosine-5)-methyltransferase 1
MKEINQLDLFSGIGGFHLGFERAGYKVNSYFSEVDKHAIAVYQHQFKDSTYVGSVTDVRGGDLPRIDLITFGSPCQDFSQAGSRRGLTGDRSSLIAEAIRLIGECRPRVFIWENVKGAFSSNDGADFAAILQAFVNIGGYRLEWQLLNTSWFLPQNRERVYLVGHLAEARGDWGGVFPITENDRLLTELNTYEKEQHRKKKLSGVSARTISSATAKMARDQTYIKVKSATSTGYDLATEGDSINLTAINSTTRRGRVGKQTAQTLDTLCEQAVVEPNYNYQNLNKTIEKNPDAFKKGKVKAIDCYNKNVRDEVPTLTAPEHNTTRMFDGYRIRRLTPIECERLQGFPDNHTSKGIYDGEVKEMSNTQRYKQCGNAVTVDVVQAIAERLHPMFEQ